MTHFQQEKPQNRAVKCFLTSNWAEANMKFLVALADQELSSVTVTSETTTWQVPGQIDTFFISFAIIAMATIARESLS